MLHEDLRIALNMFCKDTKFIKQCCTAEFCEHDRILVRKQKRWMLYRFSERKIIALEAAGVSFIVVTRRGVKSYNLSRSYASYESKMQIFNMCKGERFHKKPQNGGCRMPYQMRLSGGATRKFDAECNRVSNWGIIIK